MLPVCVMENILSSWTNFISLTFIGFVSILFVVKLYIKIRSNFKILVNCWFCNRNARVCYERYNSWDCPHCGQYNGFTDDGDYNREIFGQLVNNSCNIGKNVDSGDVYKPQNGFCWTCNDNQAIKVEKLSAFMPDNERTFAEELHDFRENLEETYRLCNRCEQNLSKVLGEKKKIVLGLRLAQKVNGIPNGLKQFTKPAHIYISTRTRIFRRINSGLLFVLAITNWLDVIGNMIINREKLNTTYGPIIASVIFMIITHLAALTRVLTKYFGCVLKIHIIEKTLLFVRTVVVLSSYTVGLDYYKQVADFYTIVQNAVPFVTMFLAFGRHLSDGFKVTKTTYLLALWSMYTTLSRDGIPEEYIVYKVLASLAIVLLSLPSFEGTDKLHRILDNTANSFHRIESEDYLNEPNSTVTSPARSTHKNLNVSKSSDEHSSGSISPTLLGQSMTKRNLTSSTFNLYTSPVSAFKSYSTEQLLPNKATSVINNRYTLSPMAKSISANSLHLNASLCSRHDDTLNKTLGCTTPTKSFVSCAAASISSRQSLLSPSHFNGNNTLYCTSAYAAQQQPSWLSGGFFNHNNKPDNRKNYFLNNLPPSESISRGSSQSSGFESRTSSVNPGGDRIFSRENSTGRGDAEHLSVYGEPQQPLDLHKCNHSSIHNKSFEVPPLPPSSSPLNRNIFQSKVMDFASGDHWVRNSPVDFNRQSFQADYLANLTIDCNTNSNPFDFNGMNTFLPPIRKRYNLLGSISEQQQHTMRQPFRADIQ